MPRMQELTSLYINVQSSLTIISEGILVLNYKELNKHSEVNEVV